MSTDARRLGYNSLAGGSRRHIPRWSKPYYLIGRVDAVAVARVCEERVREKASAFAAIDEDVVALVSELRGRGLSLAVISNCFAEDVRSWSTWPLACEFQCSVFSCVAGLAKPDPEIYLKATRGFGVEPDAAGAGSIGQAVARRVSAGKHVLLSDLRDDNADAAAKTLSDAGST